MDHVRTGHVRSVIMHAAVAGDRLDQVPFLLNSPKDTVLARILEEAVLSVDEDAHDLSMPEWAKHCAELLASKSLSDRAKTALTLGVNDFFHHETWAPNFPPTGLGPGGADLPGTVYLRAPASQALLQLVWSGDFAFASGGSLAAVGRLFGYRGGLITTTQRTAMSQADVVMCDLFIRLTQGGTTSIPEEDAIELTEGWRNSQWPACMVTLPTTRAAGAVDLKRMFEYAAANSWNRLQ